MSLLKKLNICLLITGLIFAFGINGLTSDEQALAKDTKEGPQSAVTGYKVPFWLGNPHLGVFDNQTLRYIAENGRSVVIRSKLNGPMDKYNYANVVQRLHEMNPELPVLNYATLVPLRPITNDNPSVEDKIVEGFEQLDESLLMSVTQAGGIRYGDFRKEDYRNWLIGRTQDMIEQLGTDGVAFDLSYRYPIAYNALSGWAQSDPEGALDYAEGVDAFYSTLKNQLNGQGEQVIFNGIWKFDTLPDEGINEQFFQSQVQLLDVTDGGIVEYFGLQPNISRTVDESSLELNILPYLDAMQTHPDKSIAIYARGPWSYIDYEDEYRWQRYLYAWYLMASNEHASFKYHNQFQVPTGIGRVGGLDIFYDQSVNMGNPLSDYENQNGLYCRTFENGIVLVVPKGDAPRSYKLSRPMYTPEGKRLQGTITVQPGRGLLLTRQNPVLPTQDVVQTFEDPNAPGGDWLNANLAEEDGNNYLQLTAMPTGQEWEHDLMLEQPIRSLFYKPSLDIDVRSADPNAKIMLVAEVDDANMEYNNVVIEITAQSSEAEVQAGNNVLFRRPDSSKIKAAHLLGYGRIETNGQWQHISIDAERLLKAAGDRFIFRRWSTARMIGTMDVDNIVIKQNTNQEEVDKSKLFDAIAGAIAVHDTAEEGSELGQYQPGSKDILQSAIEQAFEVYEDPYAEHLEVVRQVYNLQEAINIFARSRNRDVDVVLREDFENQQVGSLPEGYQLSGDTDKIRVEETPDSNNSTGKSLAFHDFEGQSYTVARQFDPRTADFTIEFKVKAAQNTGARFNIQFKTQQDRTAVDINLNGNGALASDAYPMQKYNSDEWYPVLIEVKPSTQTYDVYLDGKKIYNGLPFVQSFPLGTPISKMVISKTPQGDFYLDDVNIWKEMAKEHDIIEYDEMITNGGFEDDFDAWRIANGNMNGQGGLLAEVSSEDKHAGNKSLHLVDNSTTSAIQVYQDILIDPTKTYRVDFWAKWVTGNTVLFLQEHRDPINYTLIKNDTIVLDNSYAGWKRYTTTLGPAGSGSTFTLSPDTRRIQLKLSVNGPVNGNTGEAYYDDISFKNICEVPIDANNANVSNVEIHGIPFDAFAQQQYSYQVLLPEGQIDLPAVTASSESPRADICVWEDQRFPGRVTIIGVAQDRVSTRVYTIDFVNTSIIRQIIDRYEASDDIKNPLFMQLSNDLKQAEQKLAEANLKMVVKHMENFKKHLNNKAMSKFVSEDAKAVLNTDADALIEAWTVK